jgi:hypothetical protein
MMQRLLGPLVAVAVTLACSSRFADADPAQEHALTELAKLGASGLPAVCAAATLGMPAKDLPNAWPGYQATEGMVEYGRNAVYPLFDRDMRLLKIVIALSPVLEPEREYIALEQAWGKPAITTDVEVVWLWPDRRVRGSASHDTAAVVERYLPLGELELATRLSIAGKTVADAEHLLGISADRPFANMDDYISFDLPKSEYGSVTMHARLVHGRLDVVDLTVDYPTGMLPRVIDALGAHEQLVQDPANKLRWRSKRVTAEVFESGRLGALTFTRGR